MGKRLNQSALAKALGVTPAAVSRHWVRHAEWSFGAGPWTPADVRKIAAWGKTHLSTDRSRPAAVESTAGMSLSQRAKLSRDLEAAREKRLKNDVSEKRLHDVEECRVRRVGLIHKIKGALCHEVPEVVADDLVRERLVLPKAKSDVTAVILRHTERLCQQYAQEVTA